MAASLGNGRSKARLLTVIGVALVALVLPASAEAYSISRYRAWDAGSLIRHAWTICADEPGQRFYVAARTETLEGYDKRFRYSNYRVYGCERNSMYYPDVLKYTGTYYGRIKVRLAQTDWIQFSRWDSFYSG